MLLYPTSRQFHHHKHTPRYWHLYLNSFGGQLQYNVGVVRYNFWPALDQLHPDPTQRLFRFDYPTPKSVKVSKLETCKKTSYLISNQCLIIEITWRDFNQNIYDTYCHLSHVNPDTQLLQLSPSTHIQLQLQNVGAPCAETFCAAVRFNSRNRVAME